MINCIACGKMMSFKLYPLIGRLYFCSTKCIKQYVDETASSERQRDPFSKQNMNDEI